MAYGMIEFRSMLEVGMEGNECYHYHTVARYIAREGRPPVRAILEVGVNVGAVTRELVEAFPSAMILGYEAMPELAEESKRALADCPKVIVRHRAVTCLHLFRDDLGEHPHPVPVPLICYEALPSSGPGWWGGSKVGPEGMLHSEHYRPLSQAIPALTLEESIQELLALVEEGASQVDYLKTDCEGSECSFLGSASLATLAKIQWIAGEYHDLDRFCKAIHRLSITHRVALIGQRSLGAFFAERRDEIPGLLSDQPLPSRDYLHLGQKDLTWHPFKPDYVLDHERWAHGIGE